MKNQTSQLKYLICLVLFLSLVSHIKASTPIECNGDISASISAPGEVDSYCFEGEAGDRIIIRMKGDLFSLDAKLELFGPDNTLLETSVGNNGGLARIGSTPFPLPQTGTYTIKASDDGNNETESYGISLQFIKASCASPISCDSDLNANIENSAGMDAFFFDGQQGEKIIARMKGDQFSLDPRIELYDPDGLLVNNGTGIGPNSNLARIGALELEKTGTYILVTMDEGGEDEENYGISMQFIKASCALAISCDSDLNANIGNSAEMNAFFFDGLEGEKIIVRMKGDAFSLDPRIELYDPDGLLVNNGTGIGPNSNLARIGALELEKTGTYILVTMDEGGEDEENYGISMQFINPSCASPISCDSDLNANIGNSAEMNAFFFDGLEGEKVIVRMKGDAFSLDSRVELYDPDGILVNNGTGIGPNSNLARIGALELEKTGTYILVTMDEGGDDEEDYGLSLQFINPSCASPISCDSDLNANIGNSAEMNAFFFDGLEGEKVIVRMKGDAFSLDSRVELYDPDGILVNNGTDIGSNSNLARIGALELEKTGTYILVTMDEGGDDEEDYGLSLQFINPSCASPISCDSDLNANIGNSAEMNAFFFDGLEGEKVIVRMKGDAFSLDSRVELYDPDGILVNNGTDIGSNSNLARIGALELEKTGTYILVTMDEGGDDEEDYGLSLQFINPSCASPISCNGDLNANIGNSAEMNAFFFDGLEGEKVIVRMKGDAFSLDSRVELYDPDGILVNNGTDIGSNSNLARIGALELEKTGTYILVTMDEGGDDEEDYGLSLQFINPSCASPISCDSDLNANIGNSAEMNAFFFDGLEGEKVIVRMKGDAFSLDSRVELYDPDGILVNNGTDIGSNSNLARIGALELEKTGTYILVTMDEGGDDEEDYGLSLQFINPSCASPISCNGDLNANIGNSAEMNAFFFDGLEGEKIIIRMKGDGFGLDSRIELYDPDGILVNNGTDTGTNSSLARIDDLELPKTGTYIIVAMDDDGDEEEDYGISLQILKPSCASPISCDGDLNSAIAKSAEMDAYKFYGEEGDKMIIRARSASFSFDWKMELYRSNGEFVDEFPGDHFIRKDLMLEATDTFLLIVMDEEGNDTDDYGLSIQLLKTDCAIPLSCTEDLTENISTLAGMDAFWFEAEQGEFAILRARASTSSFDTKVEIYNDAGVLLFSILENSNLLSTQYVIPENGNYLIVLMDEDGSKTSDYGLSLQLVKPSCTDALIACGEFLNSTITHLAEIDAYLFTGLPGQRLIARVKETTSNMNLEGELYRADGSLVENYSEGELLDVDEKFDDNNTSYILLIFDTEGDDTGTYAISAQTVGSAAPCSSPILCDEGVTSSLAAPIAMNAFSFTAQAGDRGILRMRGSSNSINSRMQLFDPNGDQVGSPTIGSLARADFGPLALPGTYTVLAMDNEGDDAGLFSIALQLTTDLNCGEDISYNNSVMDNVEPATEMDGWVFSGNAGDVIVFQFGTCSQTFDSQIEMYDASGQLLESDFSNNGVSRVGPSVLPNSGDYKFIVMEKDGDETSAYGVSLQKVNPGVNATNLPVGVPVTGNISKPAEMQVFTFAAQQNDPVSLDLNSTSGDLQAIMELYSPSGGFLDSDDGNISLNSVPAGIYTVLVSASNSIGCGTGSFELELEAILNASPSFVTTDAQASNEAISVSSNCSNWISSISPISAEDWLMLSPPNGSGSINAVVLFQANLTPFSRSATITLSGCGITETINVTQSAATLFANPNIFNVEIEAGEVSFDISGTCAGDWEITGVPNWLTIDPTMGNGPATITINYGENPDPDSRQATLTLTGCGIDVQIIIIQEGTMTATEEAYEVLSMLIAPNPAREVFYVEIPEGIPQSLIQLVDGRGNKLKEIPSTAGARLAINRNGLTSGLYFLNLRTIDGRLLASGKVVLID